MEPRERPRGPLTGESLYCVNPECGYREWPQSPNHDPTQKDWKLEEYEKRPGLQINEITPQIGLGDIVDAWKLRDAGSGKPFDAILNVSTRSYEPPPDVEYVHIPLSEYGSKPLKRERRAQAFDAAVVQLEEWVSEGKKVFVHCVAGANRSVSVIMAALMQERDWTFKQALDFVQAQRPIAHPHGEINQLLHHYERQPAAKEASHKQAADDAAEFVAEVDWSEPFELNFRLIEMADVPIEKDNPAQEFFDPMTPSSERFCRADTLIEQAMGSYAAAQNPAPAPGGLANVHASAARILYHASPSKNRASILSNGIDWRQHFQGAPKPSNTRDVNYAPRANYLDERFESAVEYASGQQEPWDIWEVDAQQLNLRPDQAWFKGHTSRARIPPNRIKLVWSSEERSSQAARDTLSIQIQPRTVGRDVNIFINAFSGKEMVGQAVVVREHEALYLEGLWVDEKATRRGIGTFLFEHAKEYARSTGLRLEWFPIGTEEYSPDPEKLVDFYRNQGGQFGNEQPSMMVWNPDRAAFVRKAKPAKDRKTKDMFREDHDIIGPDEHPRLSITPPEKGYYELLSRRGLKLPAPDVYNSERYQNVLKRAPLIPLDPRDPQSVDRSIEFVMNTKGLLIGAKKETAGEYFLCPTEFGNARVNHIMYASWFAIFSANTAVESEETSFVLWQAGKSGKGAGKPGMMSKKPKIIEWLKFLKASGFPKFKQLDALVEGFDTSDESYERRMIGLSRQPGFQFKVASFFLALLGDTRSPTLDMHAIGYLIQKGKVDLPEGAEWTDLKELAQMTGQMKEISRDIGTGNPEYKMLRMKYERLAEANKNVIMRLTGGLSITANPPPSKRGMEGEKRKIKEYMRRQMEGWNGETNQFWLWYAQNTYFETHEPRRDMIHSVFFQSLFPELFTPEAMAQRDELFAKYSDPELIEEREQRMRYRDYDENLTEMRKLQPHKQKMPTPDADFDWEAGQFAAPAPAPKLVKKPTPIRKPVKTPTRVAPKRPLKKPEVLDEAV